MMSKYLVNSIAIASIAFLAWRAIENGIDGAVLLTAMSIIAGLAGYHYGRTTKKPK